MSKTLITVYSHNFSITNISMPMRRVITKFAGWFDEYEFVEKGGGWAKEFSRSYAAYDETRTWYRFHINTLQWFKDLIAKEAVPDSEYEFIIEPEYESTAVDLKMRSHIKPYTEQEPILEQLYNPNPHSKLLGLQTGGGKSLMSIMAACHWGQLTCFLMKPGYIQKWVGDIHKALEIDLDDIVTINGARELSNLINGLNHGSIQPKCVLISIVTWRIWIREHEELPEGQELVPGFPCTPDQFMQYCGFGFRVIDEVHQDFHAHFKTDLYTHVSQSLSLSATLITRNEYLAKMHKIAYPEDHRCKVPEYRKYINITAWFYNFMDSRGIKTSARGRTSYSHVEFEKSIMRSTKLKKAYFMMVYEMMRQSYLVNRRPGERCLVYFATTQMCQEAKFFFKQLMPDFKIEKFNQGDPYENLIESDICFATLIKAGTAVDVPNLTTVILTIAVDSIAANDQALGRLRDLKRLYNNEREPKFLYLVCTDFQKHVMYHKSKQELFKYKALTMTSRHHFQQLH